MSSAARLAVELVADALVMSSLSEGSFIDLRFDELAAAGEYRVEGRVIDEKVAQSGIWTR